MTKLKENVDFYYENGLVVFTAKFLLARGFCCNSKCRHCPYPKKTPKVNKKNTDK